MRLKRVSMGKLTLDDGSTIMVERLGQGRYTEAWKAHGDIVYLRVKEGEYSKEILEVLTRTERNIHIPKCSRVGNDTGAFTWYKMPLYFPLAASSKRAWSDFKALRKMREDAYDINRMRQMASDVNARFDDAVQESTLSPSIKEAVALIVNEACNYGEYLIEITKKNCAVDRSGNLILLDPLFDWDEVKSANRKLRESRGYQ
jgi:hypothetical protein